MADQPNIDKPQAWQRFTLLDVFLLQASFAIGLSVVVSFSPPAVGWLFRALAAAVLGSTIAGPIVLGTQWAFRGRRSGLSVGEWLCFAPILYAFVCIGSHGWMAAGFPRTPLMALSMLYLSAQLLFSLVALGALVRLFTGDRRDTKCPWTDAFGSGVCLLFSVALYVGVDVVISW